MSIFTFESYVGKATGHRIKTLNQPKEANFKKLDSAKITKTFFRLSLKFFPGAMTFSIMTLSMMTLRIMAFSIVTLSIMTLSMMTISIMTLSMMTLSMMSLSIMTLSIMTLSMMTLSVMTIVKLNSNIHSLHNKPLLMNKNA